MDPTDLQDNRILLLPDDFLPFGRLRGREVHQSMQQSSVATKVSQYEVFLNEVLKEDLRKANLQKARLRAELQEFEELEANLAQLRKDNHKQLRTQVEVGAEVRCQAHVPDASRVFIDIGLGFHVEVPLDDAPRVIGLRKQMLRSKIEKTLDQCANIRAHIKLTEGALAELQRLL